LRVDWTSGIGRHIVEQQHRIAVELCPRAITKLERLAKPE
jgi:hypothetical protein